MYDRQYDQVILERDLYMIPYEEALRYHGAICGHCRSMEEGVGLLGRVEMFRDHDRGPIVYMKDYCWFSEKACFIFKEYEE